jgi:hypothetical protein
LGGGGVGARPRGGPATAAHYLVLLLQIDLSPQLNFFFGLC